nr:flavin mononucleotide hydrolase 1, chloroplatic [Tanacetum cinerariifolium]
MTDLDVKPSDMHLTGRSSMFYRMKNVEAAKEAGINGIQFKNADSLQHDLSLLGITFPGINTQKQEHRL